MKWLENITWARVWGMVPKISFDWPIVLWLLLLVPLLVAVYVYLISRRKKSAFRYSNLALVKEASDGPGWRISDRKSTRLNSSHVSISYAVFCLKKKK